MTLPVDAMDMGVKMFKESSSMVESAISAFINENLDEARNIFFRDDTVDYERTKIINAILKRIQHEPQKTESYYNLIKIIQKMERIADHATNIAEELIFMFKGEVTKHQGSTDHSTEQQA